MSYTSPFSSGSAAGRTSAKLGGGDHINFCINPILFEHCDLIGVPTGLSPSAILKVHQESSTASSITLSSWKDLAVRVLSLTETAAYSVFDLYFAISGGCMQAAPSFATAPNLRPIAEYRQESSRALLNKMGGRVNEGLWSAASSSRMVSLPGLLLFLYAQHFLARLNATNANNLGGRTSKEADANSTANNNHEKISENLRQYLHDFISIVAVTRPGRVTLSDALELRLLFREFSAGVEQPFGTGIGFLWSAADKSIDVSVLMQFMRSRMVVPGSELLVGGLRGSSTTRFANNVVVQGLRDQYYQAPSPLLSEAMMQLPSSSYTIHNCTQSRIYAAAALPHTKLSALTNCTVAMGPVGGILFIHRCHNCSISALCGALIVSECTNVDLFICVNTPPVLLRAGDGGLSSVRLAPYNTFYPTLEEDLLASGINPCLNLWNAGLPSQNYVLRPADFRALTFPATAGSSSNNNNGGGGGGGGAATTATRSNPCNLPEAYRRELEQRVGRFQDISQDLRDAYRRLEDEGRKDLADGLRHKVHSMFLEWLHHSGQGSGLIDILHGSTNTTSST